MSPSDTEPTKPANEPGLDDNLDTTPEPVRSVNPVSAQAVTQPASPQQKASKPTKKSKAPAIAAAIVGAALLIFGGIAGGMYIQRSLAPTIGSTILESGVDGNISATPEETSIAAVAEKVSPSVVSIVGSTGSATSPFSRGQAAGTGIIVSQDGYVLTNNHVIEGVNQVSLVDFEGNTHSNVRVIGRDPLNDVAFLKINSNETFTAAELGNSSTIRIGQQVVAIGNALGQFSNTVTSGIISGTGRPITAASSTGQYETLTDLLQTDASINPGNSGGPLVNMAGQVIGINTAIVEDANGIGFAIPINATKGILAGVLENGTVERAYLGVNFLSITPEVANQYDLPVRQGAFIYAASGNPVAPGSPAAEAGLASGDVITKINDTELGTAGGLSSVIGQFRVGDTVTVTYLRNGETRTTDVTFSAFDQ